MFDKALKVVFRIKKVLVNILTSVIDDDHASKSRDNLLKVGYF
jgi:hypothetical protein